MGDTFKPPVTPLELSEWVVTGELIVSSDKEGQTKEGEDGERVLEQSGYALGVVTAEKERVNWQVFWRRGRARVLVLIFGSEDCVVSR